MWKPDQKIEDVEFFPKNYRVTRLVLDVAKHTALHGIDFQLVYSNTVLCDEDDIPEYRVSGFLDEVDRKVLVVATKKPVNQWVMSLAHEYGHFLQWLEGYSHDNYFNDMNDLEAYTIGCGGVSKDRAFEAIKTIQRVELDAEKRALGIMERYGIEINTIEYKQSAFLYILYYSAAAHTGVWPKRRVLDLDGLYTQLPERFPTQKDIREYTKYLDLFYEFNVIDKA